jgi:hypothetical protein
VITAPGLLAATTPDIPGGGVVKEEINRIRADYPKIFETGQQTSGCYIRAADPRGTFEVTPEEREAFWEKLYGAPGFGIWLGNFRDVLSRRKANKLISDSLARKILQRIQDPAWPRSWSRRVTDSARAAWHLKVVLRGL